MGAQGRWTRRGMLIAGASSVGACGVSSEPVPPSSGVRFDAGVITDIEETGALRLQPSDGAPIALTLAGLALPLPALEGEAAVPYAKALQAHLSQRVLQRPVVVAVSGGDRWGRQRALVWPQGRLASPCLQEELVRLGLARVEPETAVRSHMLRWLRVEARARAQSRGLWSAPLYAVRSPHSAAQAPGRFHLVQGRLRRMGVHRGRRWLSFHPGGRRGLLLTFPRGGTDSFEPGWLAEQLGAWVRVRGVVSEAFPYSMLLTEAAQLEPMSRFPSD